MQYLKKSEYICSSWLRGFLCCEPWCPVLIILKSFFLVIKKNIGPWVHIIHQYDVKDYSSQSNASPEPHVVVDFLASYEVLSMVLMQWSRCRCFGHFVLLSDWLSLNLLVSDLLVLVVKWYCASFPFFLLLCITLCTILSYLQEPQTSSLKDTKVIGFNVSRLTQKH